MQGQETFFVNEAILIVISLREPEQDLVVKAGTMHLQRCYMRVN